jgi:heptosyltransferase-1
MATTRFCKLAAPVNLVEDRCRKPLNEAARRILIVRLGAFGDVLMGTPLIKALRLAYPDAWLTWVVEEKTMDVLYANPYLDELLLWHGGEMSGKGGPHRLLSLPFKRAALRRELRKRCFDTFISFQAEELLDLTRSVNARKKIGFFDYFHTSKASDFERSVAQSLFTDVISKEDHPTHKTQQYLSVLDRLDIERPADLHMDLGFTSEDENSVSDFLVRNGLASNDPYIVFAPLTNWQTRNWPLDRFAQLADALDQKFDVPIVVIGSRDQAPSIEMIQKKSQRQLIAAAGVFGFRQVAALIHRSMLLVGGDSGPMHAAAAVNTPFVAIFGATPVDVLAPVSNNGLTISRDVSCGPCYQTTCMNADHPLLCLDLIEVNDVFFLCSTILQGVV